jgi:hypothetical protein
MDIFIVIGKEGCLYTENLVKSLINRHIGFYFRIIEKSQIMKFGDTNLTIPKGRPQLLHIQKYLEDGCVCTSWINSNNTIKLLKRVNSIGNALKCDQEDKRFDDNDVYTKISKALFETNCKQMSNILEVYNYYKENKDRKITFVYKPFCWTPLYFDNDVINKKNKQSHAYGNILSIKVTDDTYKPSEEYYNIRVQEKLSFKIILKLFAEDSICGLVVKRKKNNIEMFHAIVAGRRKDKFLITIGEDDEKKFEYMVNGNWFKNKNIMGVEIICEKNIKVEHEDEI